MVRTWFSTGASRGFGALIAEQALERGDNVVATARDPANVTNRLGASPNLLAVTRAVLPHMRRQRSGHVLNTSSIGGYAASAGCGVYCSTKFAVEGLTEALALELKPFGIRATVIEPGFFRTDFLDARSLSVSLSQIDDYADTAGAMRNFAATANHGQPGDPAKLARALMTVVDAEDPPLRMPFGSDTVRRIEDKNVFMGQELTRWRSLAVSTDVTAA